MTKKPSSRKRYAITALEVMTLRSALFRLYRTDDHFSKPLAQDLVPRLEAAVAVYEERSTVRPGKPYSEILPDVNEFLYGFDEVRAEAEDSKVPELVTYVRSVLRFTVEDLRLIDLTEVHRPAGWATQAVHADIVEMARQNEAERERTRRAGIDDKLLAEEGVNLGLPEVHDGLHDEEGRFARYPYMTLDPEYVYGVNLRARFSPLDGHCELVLQRGAGPAEPIIRNKRAENSPFLPTDNDFVRPLLAMIEVFLEETAKHFDAQLANEPVGVRSAEERLATTLLDWKQRMPLLHRYLLHRETSDTDLAPEGEDPRTVRKYLKRLAEQMGLALPRRRKAADKNWTRGRP